MPLLTQISSFLIYLQEAGFFPEGFKNYCSHSLVSMNLTFFNALRYKVFLQMIFKNQTMLPVFCIFLVRCA